MCKVCERYRPLLQAAQTVPIVKEVVESWCETHQGLVCQNMRSFSSLPELMIEPTYDHPELMEA